MVNRFPTQDLQYMQIMTLICTERTHPVGSCMEELHKIVKRKEEEAFFSH